MFFFFPKQILIFWSRLFCLSASALNLDWSKILSFGKELNAYDFVKCDEAMMYQLLECSDRTGNLCTPLTGSLRKSWYLSKLFSVVVAFHT